MLKRWSDFRRRQREILRASSGQTPIGQDGGDEPVEARERGLLTDTLPMPADLPPLASGGCPSGGLVHGLQQARLRRPARSGSARCWRAGSRVAVDESRTIVST